MEYETLEIKKYIQIAKEKHKEGNLNQANEIYKKLINQNYLPLTIINIYLEVFQSKQITLHSHLMIQKNQ